MWFIFLLLTYQVSTPWLPAPSTTCYVYADSNGTTYEICQPSDLPPPSPPGTEPPPEN